jgi:hypothetical protein
MVLCFLNIHLSPLRPFSVTDDNVKEQYQYIYICLITPIFPFGMSKLSSYSKLLNPKKKINLQAFLSNNKETYNIEIGVRW